MRSRKAQDAFGSLHIQTLVETSDLLGTMPILGVIEERLHWDTCMTNHPLTRQTAGYAFNVGTL